MIQGGNARPFPVADEAAAAAERQQGDVRAGAAQRAHRHTGGGDQRRGYRTNCGSSDKITTGDAHTAETITPHP